ncbi:MAG: ATP-binding cassette domain-containing protein [Prolixibacteraceae bacterium]
MINWQNIQIKIRTSVLLNNVDLKLKNGASLGIIGANSCGKTILAKAIAGLLPIHGKNQSENYSSIYVSFQSDFQLKHGARGYRQQRWNWTDPEYIPTVQEEFDSIENQMELQKLIHQFNFENHLNRFVISLSNGEQRKFELIKALSGKPDVLVIDNAFNGLDKSSRTLLHEMLNQLIIQGHSLVLTGLNLKDFPEKLMKFIIIDKEKKCSALHRSELPEIYTSIPFNENKLQNWKNSSDTEIIHLNKLYLKMGEKTILKNISWTIQAGECWVLSGANGSGKTSLLNMIFADNPKAYQCDIRLFGKQKGSGESIWDIKNRIGFVSPEMHQYLPGKQKVNDVICSGFFVSEGLYQQPTSFQRNLAAQWLNFIGLKHLNEVPFGTLSASAQRMVLILRSLVKNPPLILLDEPFQGLDPNNIERMKTVLKNIAQNTNCAMIFVSHYSDEIPEGFNLELRLNSGEIEYIGKIN